jgi:hypothetical protein
MGASMPFMTPEQRTVFVRCFRMGCGALQSRVLRGDEDDQLKALLDMYEAYFAICRSKLGHDHVPIATWETHMMVKWRNAQVQRRTSTGAAHDLEP